MGRDLTKTSSELRENMFLRMTLLAIENVRLERTFQGDASHSPPLQHDQLCLQPLSKILQCPLADCYSASLKRHSLMCICQNLHIISHPKTLHMLRKAVLFT